MRPRISRAIVGVVLAGAMLLAVSACSNPPGTDGDLTNQWPALAAVAGWEPKVATCHRDFSASSNRANYLPVECTTDHRYETVHVGQFAGDAAKLATAPLATNPHFSAAWSECDTKATEFVGAEWRTARFGLRVAVPSTGNWEGGARWFRCEVFAKEPAAQTAMVWKKSLKGELAAASELKLGCYQIPESEDDDIVPVDCTAPHNGEFAGVFAVTQTYDELEAARDSLHQKCRSVIAGYVGVPDNGDMKYRTGSSYTYPGKTEWEMGDHSIRCRIYLGDKKVSRSLKGTGNSGLPIN